MPAKKIYLFRSLFSIVLLLIFNQVAGQGILRTEGKKIVNGLGEEVILKGMGLGGWMLQEGYMMQTAGSAPTQHELKKKIAELVGQEGMETFYDAWLANHVTKADIDSLASWGFNSVRLPMHYNLYTPSIQEEPVPGEITWLEKGFVLTDSLLSWCKANEMYLILDLHAAPGGQGYDRAISDYDESKPSLWENVNNRNKTVALWRKLAERYKDEEWIGGYDLINETNWSMDNNQPLFNLYKQIVAAIREVDTGHIIFIEGNWFANDFTGLTPPFDDNMVYSFHKYWSTNNQGSIQWVLDIRDTYNVPLWLGESGENSNVWFRDAIKLMKVHNIGWAWWPMKKIESIAGPLYIRKNEGYQNIINYWDGNGQKPSVEDAMSALMELAENAKIQNCHYNRDVIHAMFDQVEGDVTIPFTQNTIPGLIYSTDFDIGSNNKAYYDRVVANYQVSTGNYTAWNEGWWYRNDGVDIQETEDSEKTNGFNVGWIDGGEWMNYTVNVEEIGFYRAKVRVASESGGGGFHFEVEGEQTGTSVKVGATGGWQTWTTVTVRNIYLQEGEQVIRYKAESSGVNLGSFEFEFVSVTGLENTLAEVDLTIYPNPCNGRFKISTPLSLRDYRLIFPDGRLANSGFIGVESAGNYNIDLTDNIPGIYILSLTTDSSLVNRKIIIR